MPVTARGFRRTKGSMRPGIGHRVPRKKINFMARPKAMRRFRGRK